ncbi:co-chaperone GroES [Tissierella praeacuta]|uniref:Co-chaperonin GroES n=1 Tax=Tissierella praeacuta DSM 18095 TaxID=1123404 RepID=A0A1M4XM57_9FIRM|nr:co-chaperone GroES [Tissierella praeacuta]HAE92300.1 co-chaperone GroES [Tissierella sp.]MBU5256043.1 co-chaperone GroES [Tissierella praeacuta]TCU75503.1 chaperonin GroES [Tissierella praeacuta]SHE94654.1 chaperonin GroES [Tissierella praeacuta DSM 18095]SUO99849.1 co-chaperonin GroES [Tissierella praeacuta]
MNLRPLGDRIVIKKVEVEEKTKSGIVLPSTAKEQPQMAEVVAIGADITNDEKKKDQIKVGDKVIFSKYAGTEIKVDGEELTILKLSDILAIVE